TSWDASTGRLRRVIAPGDNWDVSMRQVAISWDVASVLGVGNFGLKDHQDLLRLRLVDVARGRVRLTFGDDKADGCGLALLPSGKHALVGGRHAVLWDLAKRRPARTLRALDGAHAPYVVASADGDWAACWSVEDAPRVWDLRAGRVVCCLEGAVRVSA